MGFFDWVHSAGDWIKDQIEYAVDWVIDKVEDAVDWVTDKLSKKQYNEGSVEDHVDVDAVLAKFRATIQGDIDHVEKKCMESISTLFSDLTEKTKVKFPDLVEIIENEQQKAENELKGTIMKYVKEHLSKNDPKFLKVLKMNPGQAKDRELDIAVKRVFDDAEKEFDSKLKKHAEHVLEEFTTRLNNRIADQETRMNARIKELEDLQLEAEGGQIDVDALKDKSAPVMESSKCIIQILGMEM